MSGIRTLNGVGSNSQNYSLIKFYNLSDLTDVSSARVNLGLVGSLNIASSPYLSISAPYNGLSNQIVSINASINGTPNKLVAYDVNGNIKCNVIESNLLLCSTFNVLPESDPVFSFNGNDFDNIGNINCNVISINNINSSNDFIKFNDKDLKEIGNITVGDSIVVPNLSTNSISTAGTDISFNARNLSNIATITSTRISTPSITSSITDISFNSKNITNVNNLFVLGTHFTDTIMGITGLSVSFSGNDVTNIKDLTVTNSISTSSITSATSTISFNNKRLTNMSNVSKQLWAYTNTTNNTSSVLSSIPINSQSVMNLTTSTLFTYRTSISFTYNGESALRLSYVRQILGSSSGLFIVLGLYSYDYVVGPPLLYNSVLITSSQSVEYNNGNPSADTVSIALGGLGLTIGGNYTVALADKATTAGMQFYLYNPEITLLY